MVKHIVTFKLKGTEQEKKEVALKFKTAIEALPETISVLKNVEVGLNENPNEKWDIVLTAEVETMEHVSIYSKHPDHIAAAKLLSELKEDRACVDYTV